MSELNMEGIAHEGAKTLKQLTAWRKSLTT